MKRKNISSQAVTKADLEIALKGVATKEDLKRFATKAELKNEIKLSAEETVKRLEEIIMGVKDILMNTMDSFAKDIELNREDRELAVHQTSELREEIENHEKRIKRLEKVQQVA